MDLHDRVIEAVVGWAKTTEIVEAAYSYGSYARSEHTPASDLDLAILTNGMLSKSALNELRIAMPFPVIWHNDESGKSVFYLGDTLFKLDLVFSDNLQGLLRNVSHGGSSAPILRNLYQRTKSPQVPVGKEFSESCKSDFAQFSAEGLKFVNYFETASRYHRRSDGFLFYFHYNLALTCLARMFAMLESKGAASHLYAPRNILSNLGGNRITEAKSWHALRGTLYLPEAHHSKERLALKFTELLQRATVMGIDLPAALNSAPEFISKVIVRDLFFNLRDFASAYGTHVNSGVLFRGPTITRWQGTKELQRFLEINDVRQIIDFRESAEIQKDGGRLSYDPAILAGRNYINIPIGDAAVRPDGKSSYLSSLLANTNAYVRAYKSLTLCNGPCLVHCHVGKDRTGIFCALLARVLDLPREAIVYDYILSEQGVKAATINSFLDEIEGLGGAETVLRNAGLNDADIKLLRSKLLA